jgi:hypothetical protein
MHENKISDIKFSNSYLKQIYDVQKTFTREFNLFLITMLKYCPKKTFDATLLGKPNRSFLAFSDNKLTLLIRTIKTPFQ